VEETLPGLKRIKKLLIRSVPHGKAGYDHIRSKIGEVIKRTSRKG
jgi:hypothetical protein